MPRLLMLALLALLGALPLAHAADTVSFSFAGCTDSIDRPVQNQADPNLPVLLDTRLVDGKRVIYYNPSLLPELQPETRAFLYAHECAWTRLGMPVVGERSEEDAHRADCWAVETLARSRLITNTSALESIEGDLALVADNQALLPGPARNLNLAACPASKSLSTRTTVKGNALKLADHPASPAWNACTQVCGNKLYACGRSSTCMSSFNQCQAACGSK